MKKNNLKELIGKKVEIILNDKTKLKGVLNINLFKRFEIDDVWFDANDIWNIRTMESR